MAPPVQPVAVEAAQPLRQVPAPGATEIAPPRVQELQLSPRLSTLKLVEIS